MNIATRNNPAKEIAATAGEAESTLRLIANLPAPEGLELRVKTALRSTPKRSTASLFAWPSSPFRSWAESAWMRGAAAAAIVCVVVGGGWQVYSRVQPKPTALALPSCRRRLLQRRRRAKRRIRWTVTDAGPSTEGCLAQARRGHKEEDAATGREASRSACAAIVWLLLRKGADQQAKNRQNSSADKSGPPSINVEAMHQVRRDQNHRRIDHQEKYAKGENDEREGEHLEHKAQRCIQKSDDHSGDQGGLKPGDEKSRYDARNQHQRDGGKQPVNQHPETCL